MFELSLRYLSARPRQTLLMLLGVLLGTAAFIALSGLLIGFKDYLVNQLVNNSASVHIEPAKDGGFIRDLSAWSRRLDSDRAVAAWSPQLIVPALFTRSGSSAAGLLAGCDPARQARVSTISSYVAQGRFADLAQGGARVALGAVLASKLGLELGQTVSISTSRGRPESFRVAAVFKTGVEQQDSLAYAPLAEVQALSGARARINEIAVRLEDYSLAGTKAGAWSRIGPDKAESWDQKNANIVDTFKSEDMIRFLSLAAVLLVAGFGIYNVLNMTVTQKRMDIAILRSLGYGRGDVLALFLWQGFLLGLAGILLGCLAGWGLDLYLRTVSVGGNPLGSGTGTLAVSLAPRIFCEGAAFALVSACLSTILPAYAAAKLDPIEIIRAGAS
ncbi:MAG TPA: ABC transporter permease [bacterium]|nr:ABC transporter permease [bacterium]